MCQTVSTAWKAGLLSHGSWGIEASLTSQVRRASLIASRMAQLLLGKEVEVHVMAQGVGLEMGLFWPEIGLLWPEI